MSIKVISERNLDNKTIRKNTSGTSIEVAVAESEDNALKVTEQGPKVEKPQTVQLQSLGGEKIGDVIVQQISNWRNLRDLARLYAMF